MSPAKIQSVKKNSVAERHGLKAGDELISINGRPLRDILDYEMATADNHISIEIADNGRRRTVSIEKPPFDSLGIIFETSLFDGIKTCANRCIFCFIDQLPHNMRKEVYVKDDDYRLSFLYGNFITLTNMRDEDIERIIADRLSPLYVSIHATDPARRTEMLGRKKHDRSLEYLTRLSDAGIELHIQMVLCPGLNTGDVLERSVSDLAAGFSGVESVGLVPVGLTGHREGLHPLRSFEKQEIIQLIEQVQRWQATFEREKGHPWVYIADEFYIEGGFDIPPAESYGEFPQIENGIGLSRLFIDGVAENAHRLRGVATSKRIAVVTGSLFAGILRRVAGEVNERYGPAIDVIAVPNFYFGGAVNVTGLLTGSDIITGAGRWIEEHGAPDVLLLPDVILNADGVMLDDRSPAVVAEQLGIRVVMARSSGEGFIEGIRAANSQIAK